MLQIQVINFTISITVSALSVLLGLFAWRQRHAQGVIWFTALLAAYGWINWWYAFEAVVGTDINTYVSLSKLEYVGGALIPYIWLRFALNFGGRERPLSYAAHIGLTIVPLATVLLAFTNEYHGLVWVTPQFKLIAESPVFAPVYGSWFWVYFTYAYVVFAIGSIILVKYALNAWHIYRSQALLILMGTAFPWLSNILTIFDTVNPFPYLYINAVTMGLCVVCFSFGLLRLRLLDVTPLAYDTILNNIPAGIVVLDLQNRILAINERMKTFIRTPYHDLIGHALTQSLPECAPKLLQILDSPTHKGQFKVENRIYEVSVSTAYTRDGKVRGNLFVFSDVTHELQAKQAQEDEAAFSAMINRMGTKLNSSLNIRHITSLILEHLEQIVPQSRLNIMLVDSDGYSTRVYQQRGYATEAAGEQQDTTFDYRMWPVFTQAVQQPGLQVSHEAAEAYVPTQTGNVFACIAVMGDKKPIGFINLDGLDEEQFTPELKSRLEIFGQQASLAIKNAQLYEQTRLQAEELKRRVSSLMITQQVYKDIGFSVETEQLVQLILDAALRISRADAGFVGLFRGDQLELAHAYGDYDRTRLKQILNHQSGIVHQTIAARRSLVLQVPNTLESGFAGVQAQMGLPLMAIDDEANEHLYGVIVLETRRATLYTEDRLQLLDLIRDRAAIALQNGQLVERVRERAAELEILYGKVSYLEQFKTDMIRIAAHDLKNPLGVIRNYLTMLIEMPEMELDLEKVYPSMLRSAERMLQIVQNFLSMDRIEKAAQLQTMKPFDLCKVVQAVVEEYATRSEQKQQWVDVMIPHEPCMVRGDEAQIYEAVSNFMSNAVKYTPEGGHIRVLLEAIGDTAQLEITDNGFGIPQENQAQLFQPFYRARTQETATIEGTGLGLHLTKSIIEQQDGEIIFNSVYHQGSTFGFKMPLFRVEPETAAIVERLAS